MLEKINKALGINIKKSTFACIIIILFGLLFILLVSIFKVRSVDSQPTSVAKDEILELFNNINDNYSLDINITRNDISKRILFSRDSNMELFEGSYYDEDGLLIYKDNVFELISSDNKIVKSDKNKNDLYDIYYDIGFLKKLFNNCEFDYINPVKATCMIKVSDYLNEYNQYMNTELTTEEENIIFFDIVYYSTEIGKINVDYTIVNKIINDNDDSLNYGIKIRSINNNDYNDLYEYNKDILDN